MNHHFVKRTWCRGQDPLEWADMRRRLSGKVKNQRLLLRVLRSSGQLTLSLKLLLNVKVGDFVDKGGHQDVEVAA